MPVARSRWTLPLLRWSMGLFVVLWGVDKIVAAAGAQRIFANFYQVPIGPTAVRLAGAAEVVLGLLLAVSVVLVLEALADGRAAAHDSRAVTSRDDTSTGAVGR